ncbi:MAG: LppU/SCO3897 family protein, partial [Solimonas sp.]
MSEQNPSSEAPQAPQQSFGTDVPPIPQQSFGTAPGAQETVGSAPQPAAPQPAEAQPPAKKKGLLGGVGGIVGIIVVVVLGAGAWFLNRDSASNADVGQCLAGTTAAELDADKLKIADCSAADAGFKVVGKVDNKLQSEGEAACAPYADTEFFFWSGDTGKAGTILCLATNKK